MRKSSLWKRRRVSKRSVWNPGTEIPIISVVFLKNGLVGFKDFDDSNHKIEIGYWLSQYQQGNGIMTRSVDALLDYAFEQLNMNRVQIKVAVDNKKSNRIPQKLGFKFEGVERDGELLADNKYTDINVYSLLKKEYKNGNH